MKGAISYSLFGYDKERQANCFDFNSYLRGMHICLRFNRILFPGWQMVVNIDSSTYESPYKPIFEWYAKKGFIKFNICPDNEKLCKAMLWRLKTVFEMNGPGWTYTHVICRDLDSIATYREAQAVAEWVKEDKALHCITDSVSHTIPMLGGMIGFRPGYVNDVMKITDDPGKAWFHLIDQSGGIDFSRKGSDQDFLNSVMYPKLCTHATEHFVKGRPHDLVEGNGRHYSIKDSWPEFIVDNRGNLPSPFNVNMAEWESRLRETNLLAGHIGAAGFYEAPTMKFLYYDDPFKAEYEELETMKGFEQIFYWTTREDLR